MCAYFRSIFKPVAEKAENTNRMIESQGVNARERINNTTIVYLQIKKLKILAITYKKRENHKSLKQTKPNKNKIEK